MNHLLVFCCDCGASAAVPFPVVQDELTRLLDTEGWILSMVTPPGEPDAHWAALCKDCAPKHYPPELLARAREALRKREGLCPDCGAPIGHCREVCARKVEQET